MKRFTLFLSCFLMSVSMAISQNREIKGSVFDETGEPIAGASVHVKGANLGTTTEFDGTFTLTVPANVRILTFSYLGMTTQELPIQAEMKVILKIDPQSLEEVLVIAYGTARKSSFTGSAEVIKTEKIEKRSVSNLSKALEGVVPGIQSTSGGGQPGNASSLMIRGIGSINASSSPLYVVDGAPYDGNINALNPNDVESISILKDASASALYGARGANGVILVTTKKGIQGKTSVNLKATWGTTSRSIADYERVNEYDFMEMSWEALRNQYVYEAGQPMAVANQLATANYMNRLGGEIYNPFNIVSTSLIDPNTGEIDPSAQLKYHDDWLKEAENESPLRQEYLLSLTGGSDQLKYLMSLGYLDEDGLLRNSSFERFSGRLNLDAKFTNWLSGGMNTAFSETKQRLVQGTGSSYSNVWFTALMTGPIYPVYIRDENGDYVLDSEGNKEYDYGPTRPYANNFNTIAVLEEDNQNNTVDNFSTRIFTELGDKKNENLGFFKDFRFQLNLSVDYRNTNDMLYWNPEQGNAAGYRGYLYKENNRLLSYTFNQLLYYQRKFGDHDLDIMLGHEFYSRKYAILSAARKTFPFPNLYELSTGSTLDGADSSLDRYYVESYLSRINYNFQDKYYLSGSFRTDGSSRFYKDYRWGNFWSFGGAWRMSEENFMSDVSWIDNLTLKASYGQQGNDNIGTFYAWQSLYDLAWPNGTIPGTILMSLENKDLKWEKNNNMNIGFEGRFLNGRIWATVEYFIRKTQDMLLQKTMATSTGFDGFNANVGDMKNKGVDFTVGAKILDLENVGWDISFVGSHFKNEVTKLNYQGQELIDGSRIITEGEPVNSWYLSKSAGVDPLTGKQLYWYEEDGEMKITDSYNRATANRFILGSRFPDLYGSITNDFRLGNFDLSILMTYSIGGKEYDGVYANLMTMRDPGTSWHKDMERRWKQPGDLTDVPRLVLGNIDATTDRNLIDASYFAIKNITLGYSLPKNLLKKIGMNQVRVFAVGDNLMTFTHLKGLDPQNSIYGGQSFSYVPVRNISVGIDIKF